MSNISPAQMARANEVQQKRQDKELRNLSSSYHEKHEDIIKKNSNILKNTQDDYEIKIVNLKNELETKFNEFHARHAERIRTEQERLENEVKELKQAHAEQKNELKLSQDSEINNLRETQGRFLDNAKKNFEKRMSRFKT